MSWQSKFLRWLLAVCFVVVTFKPQLSFAQFGNIRGRVVTASGAPVDDLKVIAQDTANKKPSRRVLVTDPNGAYILERVQYGTYDLTACDSPAYKPATRRGLSVAQEDVRNVNFVLQEPRSRKGSISGSIQGPAGVVVGVPVQVTLRDAETGCELRRVATGVDGTYVFNNLATPQTYELYSEYSKTNVARVAMETDRSQVANLTLDLGGYQALLEASKGSTETVTVIADAPQLIAGRAAGSSLDARTLSELPLFSRRFSQLVQLAPAAALGSINSAEDIDRLDREVRATQVETISSARESNDISLLNPRDRLKTGTNTFHGTAGYNFRSNDLDAHNFFAPPDFDKLREDTLHAAIGGPIWKDHLFVFGAYDLDRYEKAPTFSPSTTANIGDLNAQLLRLKQPVEDLHRVITNWSEDTPAARIDANITDRHQLLAAYTFHHVAVEGDLPQQLGGTSSLPSAARNIIVNRHDVLAQYNAIISPTRLNELTYRYEHNRVNIDPQSPHQLSILLPGVGMLGRATDVENGDGWEATVQTVSDNFTLQRGNHTLIFGIPFGFENRALRFFAFEAGRAIIPNLNALSAPIPQADLFQFGQGGAIVSSTFTSVAAFGQDKWQVRPDVNLNYGLRYGFQSLSFLNYRQFVDPKVGVQWRVLGSPQILLAATYGIFHTAEPQPPLNFELLMGGQGTGTDIPPAVRNVRSFIGSQAATAALGEFLAMGELPSSPRLAVRYDRNANIPLYQRGALQLEVEIGRDLHANIAYNYTHGEHVLTASNLNLPPPVLIGGRLDFQDAAIDPKFAQIYSFETLGTTVSHSLAVGASFKRGSSLNIEGTYRFSRQTDDVPGSSFEATPENVFLKSNERATSELISVHDLEVRGVWQRLSSSIDRNPLRILIAQPFLSGVLQAQSGRRSNVFAGFDANHDGNPLTDRPLTVGRNSFLGPRFVQLDASVGLRPRLGERVSMKLFLDVFNALNHTNFDAINTVLGQGDLQGQDPNVVFGRARLPEFNFREPLTKGGFGLASSAFTPRRLHIGVELSF